MYVGLSRWHVTMCGHVTGSHVINPYLSIIKAQDEKKRRRNSGDQAFDCMEDVQMGQKSDARAPNSPHPQAQHLHP